MHARTHARGAYDAAARAYETHSQPARGFGAMLSARAKTVEGKGGHAEQRDACDGAAGGWGRRSLHAVEDEEFGQHVTEELQAVPAAGWWFDRG